MPTNRISAEDEKKAEESLEHLDKAAASIQANYKKWGMPRSAAQNIVNYLDRVADSVEAGAFGSESLLTRQIEVLKEAKVIQQDTDEPYMSAFKVDQGIVQSESDEPYMSAYSDDQSSAVRDGKATNGRPLT